MADTCTHLETLAEVSPSSDGCEDCLRIGGQWVANVGEQRPNSDAKVFEVRVEIDGTDPTLRPSMTTSNKIIASVKDSTL